MILLAAGLPGHPFQAGAPIPGAQISAPVDPAVQTAAPVKTVVSPGLLQGVLALAILLILIILLASLLKKSNLKRIAALAAGLGILFALFALLPQASWDRDASAPENLPTAQQPTMEYHIAPIGEPPGDLFGWVIAGLVLCAAVLIAGLLVRAYRQRQKEDPIALEAENAFQAVIEGRDISSVIIQCYLNMERAVAEEQGFERNEAVTPREFENELVKRGIPRVPVHQLTRLFEKVRYGSQALDRKGEQEAVNCLTAIRAACQRDERGAW